MFLTVHEQFENLYDPERFNILQSIGEHLQSIGYNTLGPQITEIIRGEQSNLGKQLDIDVLHENVLVYILSMYGININKGRSSDFVTLLELLKLLDRIEKDENHEDILAIIDAGEDTLETLVNLSFYLKGPEWLTLFNYVEDIHPIFVERVKQHHDDQESPHYPITTNIRDRTLLYMTEPLPTKLLNDIKPFFDSLHVYGYDLDTMLTLQHNRLINIKEPKTLACFVKALALASSASEEEIDTLVSNYLKSVLESPTDVYNALSVVN